MRRPPRDLSDPLFNKRTVGISLLQGFFVLVICAFVFCIALWRGMGPREARALTFTTLVIANIGLILTNRSWTRTIRQTLREPNKALWYVIVGTVLLLGLVLYVPALRSLFEFSKLNLEDVLIAVGSGVLSVIWFEALKLIQRRRAPLRHAG